MKIEYFGYNCFILTVGDKTIAINPGGLFLYYFQMTTLIAEERWPSIIHILVTHGDPGHYWHFDDVAEASNAPVICNKSMRRMVSCWRLEKMA